MNFEMSSNDLQPRVPHEVLGKFETLRARLGELLSEGLIIAFSGGVDSAFLLWAAEHVRREKGGRLLALTAVSDSMAKVERDDALRFAHDLGVEHSWEESLELSQPQYAVNDGERCYYCKSELFRIGHDVAEKRGYRWLAYGYNASDRGDTRPGHRAALENEVVAPLSESELSKNEIRILMRAHGLPLSEKAASPCLSSRLMTGVAVTPQKLRDVEEMERVLRAGGVEVFRVRLHEEGTRKFLRIEVASDEMSRALNVREQLVSEGRARGYHWITLDLAGYRTGGGNL